MKRILITLALPLAVALMAFNQTGCQPAGEPAANNATPVVKETPPDTAAITTELTRIEKDWPRVVKERDGEAIRRLEADDYVGVVPDGSVSTKEQDIKDMAGGNLTAESIEVTDIKVTVLDADAAVASGRTILKGGKYKTPDGKSVPIPGHIRWVDTFVRRNGEWKLVASAAVPIQNPPAETPSPTPKASPAVTAATPATKASPAAARPSPAMRATPPPPSPKTTP
jgi:ketosteroid isomerase-like protein